MRHMSGQEQAAPELWRCVAGSGAGPKQSRNVTQDHATQMNERITSLLRELY